MKAAAAWLELKFTLCMIPKGRIFACPGLLEVSHRHRAIMNLESGRHMGREFMILKNLLTLRMARIMTFRMLLYIDIPCR